MDLHRVRRLATVLVTSQLRSGRSGSDPEEFFGRPIVIGLVDIGAFLAVLALVEEAVRSLGLPSSELAALSNALVPFLPLVAVAVVLIAGVMFELTATSKFSGSDAANWLPLTPPEYVAASSSAVAYTYSPAVAIYLGGLLPFALAGGTVPLYLLTAALSVLALFEGAVLVEMVRSVTQRASSVTAGRRGQVTLLLRALVLILVILALQLAFNPVLLLGVLQHFSGLGVVTAVVPFFWSTQALTQSVSGHPFLAAAFAVGEVAFVALLVVLAARLRVRFWVPASTEVRLGAHRYASGHPGLAFLGLSPAEAAIVTKDLRGFVRRREMLPTLVIPVVLVILVLVEGSALGRLASLVWVGWVAGFFALLLALTSLGQERKAFQSLYAYPISAANLLRAKAVSVLLPALLGAVAMSVVVGVALAFSPVALVGLLALATSGAVVLTFWGLVFAARYSDFQDRPRPQYLRPGAMIAATISGVVILFAIILPGGLAVLNPSSSALSLGLWSAGAAACAGGLGTYWARTGFDRLFQELPF